VIVAFLMSVLVVVLAYPYVAYKLLKLKNYNFGLAGIAIQHWAFNTILFIAPVSVCGNFYQPIREVFVATQFAYWIPVLIMRYWRQKFTRIDRVWVG